MRQQRHKPLGSFDVQLIVLFAPNILGGRLHTRWSAESNSTHGIPSYVLRFGLQPRYRTGTILSNNDHRPVEALSHLG